MTEVSALREDLAAKPDAKAIEELHDDDIIIEESVGLLHKALQEMQSQLDRTREQQRKHDTKIVDLLDKKSSKYEENIGLLNKAECTQAAHEHRMECNQVLQQKAGLLAEAEAQLGKWKADVDEMKAVAAAAEEAAKAATAAAEDAQRGMEIRDIVCKARDATFEVFGWHP